MKVPLSPRLQACRQYITPGAKVADIGCDHGYLGISLLKENIASFVIAADIRKMPLQSAIQNAERFGVREQMAFYLSDGVQNIPRDFDTMVCAGMGGDTMVSILQQAPWLKSNQYTLILQCQTRTHTLRQALSENGWLIENETIVRDGKFLYTVMRVVYKPGTPLTPGQCYFPPALLSNPQPELTEYFRIVVKGAENAAKHMDNRPVLEELYQIKKMITKENTYDNS